MQLLSSQPTHVRELVQDVPHHASYHDAAAEGAGGVWFSLCDNTPPVVWREGFPEDIAREVVSVDTPNGRLTNSDLELAAEVIAVEVALERMNSKHTPLGTLCDNTPDRQLGGGGIKIQISHCRAPPMRPCLHAVVCPGGSSHNSPCTWSGECDGQHCITPL